MARWQENGSQSRQWFGVCCRFESGPESFPLTWLWFRKSGFEPLFGYTFYSIKKKKKPKTPAGCSSTSILSLPPGITAPSSGRCKSLVLVQDTQTHPKDVTGGFWLQPPPPPFRRPGCRHLPERSRRPGPGLERCSPVFRAGFEPTTSSQVQCCQTRGPPLLLGSFHLVSWRLWVFSFSMVQPKERYKNLRVTGQIQAGLCV